MSTIHLLLDTSVVFNFSPLNYEKKPSCKACIFPKLFFLKKQKQKNTFIGSMKINVLKSPNAFFQKGYTAKPSPLKNLTV